VIDPQALAAAQQAQDADFGLYLAALIFTVLAIGIAYCLGDHDDQPRRDRL
jgi:hypothetical protein